MKGDVNSRFLRDFHESSAHIDNAQGGSAHRKLHAGPRLVLYFLQGDSAGQAGDAVDIEIVFGYNRGDARNLLGGKRPAEKGDDPPFLAVGMHPLLVIFGIDLLDIDLQVHIVAFKEHILEN